MSRAAALRYYDEPWQRLRWNVPAALLLTGLALFGFLWLLAWQPSPSLMAPTIEVEIVEQPPSPPQAAPSLPREHAIAPKPTPTPPQQQQQTAPSRPANSGNMGARALYQPMPEIPDSLRNRNIDLVAVARFRVAADGSARVELIQSTPEPTLNSALLDTLAKWRFFPAMENGHPVASIIDIRIPISVK